MITGQRERIRHRSRTSICTLPITVVVLGVLLALVAAPPPAEAQLGRVRNMVAGVEKGKVYELDVTEAGSSVVFVVDLTPVIELPPDAVANLRSLVTQHGEAYVRQKLAEEGTDWMLTAAGPAGLVVRGVMAQRKDRAERARNHARAAIEGLDEDQLFSLVTFEDGPATWHPMVAATTANREEARAFLGELQKADGDGFLRSALLTAAGLGFEGAISGALAGTTGAGIPGAAPGAAGMAASDPAAMQAAIAGAGAVPAAPHVPTVSSDDLLRGIEMALELQPETIVIVVGSAPAEDSGAFVARVDELIGERTVTIHTAVFGEDQPGGVLGELAEENDGKLLTENKD